jgi:hypothetical protein
VVLISEESGSLTKEEMRVPVLRIVKRYNSKSALGGLIVEDNISFNTRADGIAWVRAVQQNAALDFDLVDYEWALVGGTIGERVVGTTH